MPRTVEEIQSDIATKRAAGVHQASLEMRVLRDELKSVSEPSLPPAPSVTLTTGSFSAPDPAPPSPFDSAEWRFIEECIARMELEFGRGNTTGAVKKMYQEIDARVKARRIICDVVKQVGVGKPWPQWVTLDRNDATGEKRPPRPEPVAPVAPQVVIAPQGSAEDDLAKMKADAKARTMAAVGLR